jgi:hypothetical protein
LVVIACVPWLVAVECRNDGSDLTAAPSPPATVDLLDRRNKCPGMRNILVGHRYISPADSVQY